MTTPIRDRRRSWQKQFRGYPQLHAGAVTSDPASALGIGIFATKFWPEGEVIMRLDWQDKVAGRLIAWEDTEAQHQERVTAIAPGWYYYPTKDHPFWYLNHSCDPNLGYRNWGAYEDDSSIPLVSIRPIYPGEQILIDYSTMTTDNDGEEENVPWTMACLCKASNCRRELTDFIHLPQKLQQSVLASGGVPAFILNESQTLVNELRSRAPGMFRKYESALAMQLAFAKSLESHSRTVNRARS